MDSSRHSLHLTGRYESSCNSERGFAKAVRRTGASDGPSSDGPSSDDSSMEMGEDRKEKVNDDAESLTDRQGEEDDNDDANIFLWNEGFCCFDFLSSARARCRGTIFFFLLPLF